jgi:hypothetical protein
MEATWQVIIGVGIASLLISIFQLYRSYLKISKDDGESQKLAKWSIFFGISGIILVGLGSLLAIVFGLISMKGKKHKSLSKIGIILGILTFLPWLLVLINGQ